MAGMLAARVLSDYFHRVVLLERDKFEDSPVHRTGVPQARHLHALLPGGNNVIEELFPGISREWCDAGGEYLDVGADFAWRTPPGWGRRFDSGIRMLAASRPLIDLVVRWRLAAVPNVTILDDTMVESLAVDDGGKRVRGVNVKTPGLPAARAIPAALVVDASGRGSRAPQWLETMGYEPPRETVVDAHLGYASRIYRRSGGRRDWDAVFIQANPPDHTRGGIAFPIEGDRWIVTLIGGDRDYPPADEEGFLEFARSLPEEHVYRLIASSEALGPITSYRKMDNRWRHYEKMSARPEGFIVLGDAACAFNPVYGQGMSVASLGAAALRDCIRRHGMRGLAARFQKRLARIIATPWTLSTSEDSRYRGVEGKKPGAVDRFMQSYVDRAMAASTYDTNVRLSMLRVFGLIAGPQELFRPPIAARIISGAIARRLGRPAPPQSIPAAVEGSSRRASAA
jgi:2-polyprenyl-6-methoxyphenol hydroxylase-like FAD-dependent oxidoreductase